MLLDFSNFNHNTKMEKEVKLNSNYVITDKEIYEMIRYYLLISNITIGIN